MQQFENSEATAVRRHIYLHLVDATDGITAETGLTGVGRISKNGATTAATSGSLVEIDATNMPGRYYIVLTATELNTDGMVEVRYKAAACAEGVARGQVVPWDPYSGTNMGLTFLDASILARTLATAAYFDPATDDVDVRSLQANTVNAAAVATGAVTAATFALSAINAAAIATNAIGSLELATDAVNKIRDAILDELTASHVGAGSVGEVLNNLPNDGALTFLDASILARTLATAAYFDAATDDVDVRSLQANVITAAAINAAAITAAKFAAGGFDAAALNADAVDKIRDGILPTQNAAFPNIPFLFVDSTDHVTPVTSASTISGTRSIDGGAFTAVSGSIAEIGNGIYQFDALAADMNGGIITFRFIATGGTPNAPDDAFVTVVTGGGV